MAKKIKPKSLLDSVSLDTSTDSIVDNNDQITDNALNDNVILSSNLNKEQREKLEKYDAMEQTVADLVAEKEQLQEKLEEYMLSNSNTNELNISALREENERLTNELQSLKMKANSNASKIVTLQNENSALREENDQYLMKISELTFDNANLTCQLDQLSKTVQSYESKIVNQTNLQPKEGVQKDTSKLGRPFYNPYDPYKNNGYGSW